jgi:HD-like signal output (HDOD) protein
MSPSPSPQLLDEKALDALVSSIRIPPRPSLLTEVQREMASDDPDPRKIAELVSKDVAMSASLLKSANSAFFGLSHKAETVEQAAALIGLNQCCSLLLGLIVRKAMHGKGLALSSFWDNAAKRSYAMARMARTLHVCPPDTAHTFGLFCDIGIPMLLSRFPDYSATLREAHADLDQQITTHEDRHHGTNHATISAIMSRSWGLSPDVTEAIRFHHDYAMMTERNTSKTVSALLALCVLSERAIQLYRGVQDTAEWNQGGMIACDVLGLSQHDADDWCDTLHHMFDAEQ